MADSGRQSGNEADKKRAETQWRMLARPPKPHHPSAAAKPKLRPAHRGRINKGKSRT